jgi:UrcA family protein
MRSKILVATLATAALCGLCAPASAATLPAGYETISTTVHVGDLNLARQPDARTALSRIHIAAKRVCGSAADHRDLEQIAQRKACIGETLTRTISELGVPTVSAVFADSRLATQTYAANDRER